MPQFIEMLLILKRLSILVAPEQQWTDSEQFCCQFTDCPNIAMVAADIDDQSARIASIGQGLSKALMHGCKKALNRK
jgi:hypothetical protein